MFILSIVVSVQCDSSSSLIFIVSFVLIVFLYAVFTKIMKSPSKKGRFLMDKLEGFKLYLEVAEKDNLNLRTPSLHPLETVEAGKF